MKIEELLVRNEDKTLEFKRDLTSPRNILKTIISFANTAGGTILIGIDNDTKAVLGLENPLVEQERLCNLIADSISPRLVPDVRIINWRGQTLLAVEVFLSGSRPHYLNANRLENGTFVRVGPTNRLADQPLIREMQRTATNHSFDEEPMPAVNPEAIDFRVASGLISGLHEQNYRNAVTLNLLTQHQGRLVPTVGGMLLFGTLRERYFPDAWIQCGRFGGTNKSVIKDQLDVHDHLPVALEKAFEFIKKHGSQVSIFGELKRKDVWNFPLVAIREALVNAIVHADYSQTGAPIRVAIFDDRIEIENQGLLAPGLTLDDVRGGVSKLRNRVIGRIFKELNLIEQWGSGFQRMVESCREMNLPEPVIEEVAMRFRVTINLRRIFTKKLLDEKEEMIMIIILENEAKGGISTKEISMKVGISDRAVRDRLARMIKAGRIVALGKSNYDPNKKYLPAKD